MGRHRRLVEREGLVHAGWVGPPGASDFSSIWGLITRAEMFDGREHGSTNAAAAAAKHAGFRYFIAPKPSLKHDCILYRQSGGIGWCVYTYIEKQATNAEAKRTLYASSIENRIAQILRVSASRAEVTVDFLAIMERVRRGRCEASGVALDLERVGAGRSPAIVRRDPAQPFTPENTVVACTMFGRLLDGGTFEEAIAFLKDAAGA